MKHAAMIFLFFLSASLVAAPIVTEADLIINAVDTNVSNPCVFATSPTSVGSCTAGLFVEVTRTFTAGDLIFGVNGRNNTDIPFSDPYVGFQMQIDLDGNSLGVFVIDTDNQTIRSTSVTLSAAQITGTHTLRATWLNDFCPGCSGGSGDANLIIENVFFENVDDQNPAVPPAVPEPSSCILFGAALGFLLLRKTA